MTFWLMLSPIEKKWGRCMISPCKDVTPRTITARGFLLVKTMGMSAESVHSSCVLTNVGPGHFMQFLKGEEPQMSTS